MIWNCDQTWSKNRPPQSLHFYKIKTATGNTAIYTETRNRPATLPLVRVSHLLSYLANLRGEVTVEDAFRVQVGQAAGDFTGQLHPGRPAKVFVAVQELLQVTTIDVLETERDTQKSIIQYIINKQ